MTSTKVLKTYKLSVKHEEFTNWRAASQICTGITPRGDVRPSQSSHMGLESAPGFLPWLISKVAPPLLPPQALSNQPNPSDKYSRRKAAGLAGDRQRELALGQLCGHCNRVTCTCLNQELSLKLCCPGTLERSWGLEGKLAAGCFSQLMGQQVSWIGMGFF